MVFDGLTTSLTIYGFGLPGNSVAKSIRKHRFRTEKPEKAHQTMQKIGIGAFGTRRIRRFESCHLDQNRGFDRKSKPQGKLCGLCFIRTVTMNKKEKRADVSEERITPLNNDSVTLLLSTSKAEYDNEHRRTGIIDTKVSISLPIVSAFELALVQINNFKVIFALPSSTFLLWIKPAVLFFSYVGALVLGLVSVCLMAKVIMTREYKTLKIRDLYDEDILKEECQSFQVWLINLYCESTEHNKKENDIRANMDRKGWKYVFFATISFIAYSIFFNLFF